MPKLFDYTRKDIIEIREWLIQYIKENYYDKWTDFNESDLGMVFVELAAGIADMMNFQIDKEALECYIPTVVQRKNAKGILALLNYQFKGMSSAVTNGKFSLVNEQTTLDYDLPILAYTQVCVSRKEGNIYYATSQDCRLLAGTREVEVPLRQGIVTTHHMTVADLAKNRTMLLKSTKVDFDSLQLYVDDKLWTKVPDVLIDIDYGTKYSLKEDKFDNAFLEFHWNWRNYLPVNQKLPVRLVYLVTEGQYGSIQAGQIDTIEDNIVVNGTNVTGMLKVTNTDNATGGNDRESVAHAKALAPRVLRAQNLMVTLGDYEAFTLRQDGVYAAKAIDWNIDHSKYISVPYKIDVYVLPTDDEQYITSPTHLKSIYEALKPNLLTSMELTIKSAEIVEFNIEINIGTQAKSGAFESIRRSAEDAIKEYFKKENQSFGQRVSMIAVEDKVRLFDDLVEYCEVISHKRIIKLKPMQWAKLGTIKVNIINDYDDLSEAQLMNANVASIDIEDLTNPVNESIKEEGMVGEEVVIAPIISGI